MKIKTEYKILIGMGLFAWLLSATKSIGAKAFLPILKTFIPNVEGFTPTAIWDHKQWSWGYGTAAGFDPNKKPTGSITRGKAWQDAEKLYIIPHYNQLSPLVKKPLNNNQWAALLSFSYNAGPGNAKNIIQTINTGNTADVITRMKKYVYASGKVNQGLINRRQKETDLYQGLQSYGRTFTPETIERVHPDLIGEVEY